MFHLQYHFYSLWCSVPLFFVPCPLSLVPVPCPSRRSSEYGIRNPKTATQDFRNRRRSASSVSVYPKCPCFIFSITSTLYGVPYPCSLSLAPCPLSQSLALRDDLPNTE